MEQYIKSFGSIVLVYVSIINLSSYKFKAKEIILMVGLAQVSSSIILNTGKFMGMIPIIIISIIFLYKKSKNLVSSISIPIVSLFIGILCEYFITYICIFSFKIGINDITVSSKLYWQLTILDLILIFIISKFLGNLINKKIKIANLDVRGKHALLIVGSLILTLIIFYTNMIFESQNGLNNEIIKTNGVLLFSYFILLMIIIYILIRSITKELEFKNKQNLIENLHKYTDNLENLNTEMRGFRHDYVNILASMIGFIENDDMRGLKKHFYKNIIPVSQVMESNNSKMVLLKNIKIPEIKGIFSAKLLRAQELGIDVFIDIIETIEEINMDIIDLSRATGILLDNAIEETERCDKPSVKVALINKENSILMVIINSCSEDAPPVYKIYEKGFSTKGENRGIGLKNLKKITEKYTNVSLETIIENREFKQYLEICKK